jgi:Tfp pilus assembly protein PilO
MGSSRTVSWVIGGILVAFALTAAAWIAAISPRLQSAAEMLEQVENEAERVNLLNVQLAGLQRDFANIEEFREQLDGLRVQIPSAVELSTLTRQINDLAGQSGVFVVSLNPGVPLVVTPPVVAAPVVPTDPAEAAEGASDEAGTDETETPAPAAPPQAAGLYAVPIEIRILGTFENTVGFFVRIQTGNPRLFLVTSVGVTAQEETGAQSGRPAVAAGDLETVITGFVFVQLDIADPADPAEVEDEGGEPGTLPVPSGQANPFAPAT